ncbi:9176_t:CDS:2, partial [Entrophospora sp. SA101]
MSPPKNNSRKFNKPSRGTGHRFTNARILAEDERRLNYNIEGLQTCMKLATNTKKTNAERKESRSEDEDETLNKSATNLIEIDNPNRTLRKDNLKASDMSNITPEMSRREREAAEKEAARQRYWKLHKEGKTEQAKTDLARLAIIKKEREEAAMKRKAEAD